MPPIGQGSCGVSALRPGIPPQTAQSGTSTTHAVATITTSIQNGIAGDERVIAQMKPRLRLCANRALQTDPAQQGTVVLLVSLAASGDVSGVDLVSHNGPSVDDANCMMAAVRRSEFPVASAPRKLSLTIRQAKPD
jgi:outer membrane biosynthesis protein TonB